MFSASIFIYLYSAVICNGMLYGCFCWLSSLRLEIAIFCFNFIGATAFLYDSFVFIVFFCVRIDTCQILCMVMYIDYFNHIWGTLQSMKDDLQVLHQLRDFWICIVKIGKDRSTLCLKSCFIEHGKLQKITTQIWRCFSPRLHLHWKFCGLCRYAFELKTCIGIGKCLYL